MRSWTRLVGRIPKGVQFKTTRWSLILAARDGNSTDSRRALEQLCEAYWYPLYAFVRGQGCDPETARDLTQGYFATLLEKEYLDRADPDAGRFRTFLRVTMKHFLINEKQRERALKRGGGTVSISLDAEEAEERFRFEPVDRLTPEQVYERRWASTLLGRVLERMAADYSRAGRAEQFEALKGYLTGDEPRARYRDVAVELEMSEVAVRAAVRRMRQKFGRLLRAEITDTVAGPEDVDDEVRQLLRRIGEVNSELA